MAFLASIHLCGVILYMFLELVRLIIRSVFKRLDPWYRLILLHFVLFLILQGLCLDMVFCLKLLLFSHLIDAGRLLLCTFMLFRPIIKIRGIHLCSYWIIPFWHDYLNIRIINILNSNKFSFNSNFLPVFHSAYIYTVKMTKKVFIIHPKRSIIVKLRITCCFS